MNSWATDSAGHPVTDLVNGCILQILPDGTLLTPDRRRITPREKAYTMLGQWSSAPFRPQDLLRFAERFTGVVYLWGGMSGKGMDCSGLVRMAYAAQGRILPRDAWQQATQGTEITSTDSLAPATSYFSATRRQTHHPRSHLRPRRRIHPCFTNGKAQQPAQRLSPLSSAPHHHHAPHRRKIIPRRPHPLTP